MFLEIIKMAELIKEIGGMVTIGEIIMSEGAKHFREGSMPALVYKLLIRTEVRLN